MPRITLSGTSFPSSMYFFASRPSGVSARTAARRMSPVVIFGNPSRSARTFPWVALPEPGAPNRRMNTASLHVALAPAELDAPFLHEAVVMAQQQMLLYLLYRVEGHAHDDEQRRAAEAERHVEDVRHDDRQHRHQRQEKRARQSDTGENFIDIVSRGGTRIDAGGGTTTIIAII